MSETVYVPWKEGFPDCPRCHCLARWNYCEGCDLFVDYENNTTSGRFLLILLFAYLILLYVFVVM